MYDIRIQPIEHITRRPGESDQNVTIRRLDRELFWMLQLGTMYRYGLNDPLQHVGNVSSSNVRSRSIVSDLLNRQKSRRRRHGRRRNSGRSSDIMMDQLHNDGHATTVTQRRSRNHGHGGLPLLVTLHSIRLQHLLSRNASSFLTASINVLEVFFEMLTAKGYFSQYVEILRGA